MGLRAMEPHCQASGQSKDQAGLVKAYRVLKDLGRYNHLLGMQNTEFVHSQTFGHVGAPSRNPDAPTCGLKVLNREAPEVSELILPASSLPASSPSSQRPRSVDVCRGFGVQSAQPLVAAPSSGK